MTIRYTARYDGKNWGAWDRAKDRWLLYPAVDLVEARSAVHRANEDRERVNQAVIRVPVSRSEPKPISNRPAIPAVPISSPVLELGVLISATARNSPPPLRCSIPINPGIAYQALWEVSRN